MREFQTFSGKPFLRGVLEGILEIPLEGGKAAAGQVPEFFHGHIEHIIPFHETGKVYLSWFRKVGQDLVYTGFYSPEDMDRFFYFKGGKCFGQVFFEFKIRNQGSEAAFKQRMFSEDLKGRLPDQSCYC